MVSLLANLQKIKSILPNSEEGGDIGEVLLSDVREEFRIALKGVGVEEKKYTRIIELGSEFFILYIESPSVVMEKKDQSR